MSLRDFVEPGDSYRNFVTGETIDPTVERSKEYATELADILYAQHEQPVTPVGGGIPTSTQELIEVLTTVQEGEVFIEVDRRVLQQMLEGDTGVGFALLYPVVVRNDDGDAIIHVTDGDRAQFGGTR